MSDAGKGSGRRPGVMPDGAWEAIFKQKELCGTCRKPVSKCGCMPTDDGPGQDGEDKGGADEHFR